jgi:hypothetical protein
MTCSEGKIFRSENLLLIQRRRTLSAGQFRVNVVFLRMRWCALQIVIPVLAIMD